MSNILWIFNLPELRQEAIIQNVTGNNIRLVRWNPKYKVFAFLCEQNKHDVYLWYAERGVECVHGSDPILNFEWNSDGHSAIIFMKDSLRVGFLIEE